MLWYLAVLQKYAVFKGRARRKEFWMFHLVSFLIAVLISLANETAGTFYSLLVFLPSFAVSVRRLHDIGRSGWWTLVFLIPIIGVILMLYWYCQDSQSGFNEYGANPKDQNIIQNDSSAMVD